MFQIWNLVIWNLSKDHSTSLHWTSGPGPAGAELRSPQPCRGMGIAEKSPKEGSEASTRLSHLQRWATQTSPSPSPACPTRYRILRRHISCLLKSLSSTTNTIGAASQSSHHAPTGHTSSQHSDQEVSKVPVRCILPAIISEQLFPFMILFCDFRWPWQSCFRVYLIFYLYKKRITNLGMRLRSHLRRNFSIRSRRNVVNIWAGNATRSFLERWKSVKRQIIPSQPTVDCNDVKRLGWGSEVSTIRTSARYFSINCAFLHFRCR